MKSASITLVALAILAAPGALAGENTTTRPGTIAGEGPEALKPPSAGETPAESDLMRMDRFVIFNQKLKTAVCDDALVSKAPSLDVIAAPEDRNVTEFDVALPAGTTEAGIVSFLLGDTASGIYSDELRDQLHRQGDVVALKRNLALEVCEGLVQETRLKKLLNATPSRFLFAQPAVAAQKSKHGAGGIGLVARVLDSSARFARVGDRQSAHGGQARASRFLIAGWVEAFEIETVTVFDAKRAVVRVYRRQFEPATNNSQGIAIESGDGVPLALLYVSQEPPSRDWAEYKKTSDQESTRARQLDAYRLRIEDDAMKRLSLHPEQAEKVRDLQEFYKDLLKAYQKFPNEKQFDSYRGVAARDAAKTALAPSYLEVLRQARVNGAYAQVGLFKPDLKLHAIYSEYFARLNKL